MGKVKEQVVAAMAAYVCVMAGAAAWYMTANFRAGSIVFAVMAVVALRELSRPEFDNNEASRIRKFITGIFWGR